MYVNLTVVCELWSDQKDNWLFDCESALNNLDAKDIVAA